MLSMCSSRLKSFVGNFTWLANFVRHVRLIIGICCALTHLMTPSLFSFVAVGCLSLLHFLGPSPPNRHVVSGQKQHHFKIID